MPAWLYHQTLSIKPRAISSSVKCITNEWAQYGVRTLEQPSKDQHLPEPAAEMRSLRMEVLEVQTITLWAPFASKQFLNSETQGNVYQCKNPSLFSRREVFMLPLHKSSGKTTDSFQDVVQNIKIKNFLALCQSDFEIFLKSCQSLTSWSRVSTSQHSSLGSFTLTKGHALPSWPDMTSCNPRLSVPVCGIQLFMIFKQS